MLGLFTVFDLYVKYGGDGLSPQSTNKVICDRRRRFLLVFDVEVKCYRPETESALKISLVQPSAPRCANGALLKYRLGSISELGILKSAVWGKYYDRSSRRRRMGYAADRCVLSGRVEHQY